MHLLAVREKPSGFSVNKVSLRISSPLGNLAANLIEFPTETVTFFTVPHALHMLNRITYGQAEVQFSVWHLFDTLPSSDPILVASCMKKPRKGGWERKSPSLLPLLPLPASGGRFQFLKIFP